MDADGTHQRLAEARSFLFVPGHRPERIAKAWASGADMVIADLEDAVAPAAKADARAAVRSALDPSRPVVVRLNGADTPWFEEDLILVGQPGVLGVILPKAERGDTLARLAARIPLIPRIETAQGVLDLVGIATIPGVVRLAIGEIDLALDLGLPEPGPALDPLRIQIVVVSRAAGLSGPVAGVTPAFDDPARVSADTLAARQGGYGAKLCIHPAQIDPVHRALAPTPAERAWAERVVAAATAATGQAVALDGQMIDRPVEARARRILANTRRPDTR